MRCPAYTRWLRRVCAITRRDTYNDGIIPLSQIQAQIDVLNPSYHARVRLPARPRHLHRAGERPGDELHGLHRRPVHVRIHAGAVPARSGVLDRVPSRVELTAATKAPRPDLSGTRRLSLPTYSVWTRWAPPSVPSTVSSASVGGR